MLIVNHVFCYICMSPHNMYAIQWWDPIANFLKFERHHKCTILLSEAMFNSFFTKRVSHYCHAVTHGKKIMVDSTF